MHTLWNTQIFKQEKKLEGSREMQKKFTAGKTLHSRIKIEPNHQELNPGHLWLHRQWAIGKYWTHCSPNNVEFLTISRNPQYQSKRWRGGGFGPGYTRGIRSQEVEESNQKPTYTQSRTRYPPWLTSLVSTCPRRASQYFRKGIVFCPSTTLQGGWIERLICFTSTWIYILRHGISKIPQHLQAHQT